MFHVKHLVREPVGARARPVWGGNRGRVREGPAAGLAPGFAKGFAAGLAVGSAKGSAVDSQQNLQQDPQQDLRRVCGSSLLERLPTRRRKLSSRLAVRRIASGGNPPSLRFFFASNPSVPLDARGVLSRVARSATAWHRDGEAGTGASLVSRIALPPRLAARRGVTPTSQQGRAFGP